MDSHFCDQRHPGRWGIISGLRWGVLAKPPSNQCSNHSTETNTKLIITYVTITNSMYKFSAHTTTHVGGSNSQTTIPLITDYLPPAHTRTPQSTPSFSTTKSYTHTHSKFEWSTLFEWPPQTTYTRLGQHHHIWMIHNHITHPITNKLSINFLHKWTTRRDHHRQTRS